MLQALKIPILISILFIENDKRYFSLWYTTDSRMMLMSPTRNIELSLRSLPAVFQNQLINTKYGGFFHKSNGSEIHYTNVFYDKYGLTGDHPEKELIGLTNCVENPHGSMIINTSKTIRSSNNIFKVILGDARSTGFKKQTERNCYSNGYWHLCTNNSTRGGRYKRKLECNGVSVSAGLVTGYVHTWCDLSGIKKDFTKQIQDSTDKIDAQLTALEKKEDLKLDSLEKDLDRTNNDLKVMRDYFKARFEKQDEFNNLTTTGFVNVNLALVKIQTAIADLRGRVYENDLATILLQVWSIMEDIQESIDTFHLHFRNGINCRDPRMINNLNLGTPYDVSLVNKIKQLDFSLVDTKSMQGKQLAVQATTHKIISAFSKYINDSKTVANDLTDYLNTTLHGTIDSLRNQNNRFNKIIKDLVGQLGSGKATPDDIITLLGGVGAGALKMSEMKVTARNKPLVASASFASLITGVVGGKVARIIASVKGEIAHVKDLVDINPIDKLGL